MTRPKVPDEKRQRTAQACDSCKRRKQKCNGYKPCGTCLKRRLPCIYTGPQGPSHYFPHESSESPHKRRQIETTPPESRAALPEHTAASMEVDPTPQGHDVRPNGEITPPWEDQNAGPQLPQLRIQDTEQVNRGAPPTLFLSPYATHGKLSDSGADSRSRHSTISCPDEEADVPSMNRMLKDPAGRFLYLGDSATLSYLQLIRTCVERAIGKSPFTEDPSRHQLLEIKVSLAPDIRSPHISLPPNEQTGRILADAFFTNTMGLIEVFDRETFETSVAAFYKDPLHVDTCTLCLVYLVFAIGLVLANPAPETEEAGIIERMRSDEQNDWAEKFYRSAKLLGDPVSGFEDADLWSIQALVLMSVYTLAISKRNAAYAYYGMAVRSAFALGLHRKEALPVFPLPEQELRCNLWRTLFVLDRFLSASLGRPTAISEDDCSEELLYMTDTEVQADGEEASCEVIHTEGLKAVVRSAQSIGMILKRVYSKRRISTALAQEIVQRSKHLSGKLHAELHWTKGKQPVRPGHGIAMLHANLFRIHTTILLARPFFLFMIHKTQAARLNGDQSAFSSNAKSRLSKYAQVCVQESYNTVFLVNRAWRDRYLSQRNPFVLYFLFAASLIILSNEFFGLYHVQTYESIIENAINITNWCAEMDPQARRLLHILKEFRAIVNEQGRTASRDSSLGAPIISSTPSSTFDAMANLPGAYDNLGRAHNPFEMPTINEHKLPAMPRHNSIATMAVPNLMEPSSSHTLILGSKLDTGMEMSSISPPQSNAAASSMDYYRTMPTPTPTSTDAAEGFGDTTVIDFDTFWNWGLPSMSGAGAPTSMSVPVPATAGFATNSMGAGASAFSTFEMHGAGPGGSGGTGLNGNIPMYPPSNFV